MKGTIDQNEITKFGKNAEKWWNEKDKAFKMLHKMNPLRIEYILKHANLRKHDEVLDVGCGGGILSQPLSRIGYNVTGLEPSFESIEIARKNAEKEGLDINYINLPLEELPNKEYDCVLLMDVLEHVNNPENFLKEAGKHLKQGGILIISTINNTFLSKIFVKGVAENILKIVPKGTHSMEKFISPKEISHYLQNFKIIDITGFSYNFISQNFSFTKNSYMNYFCSLVKV